MAVPCGRGSEWGGWGRGVGGRAGTQGRIGLELGFLRRWRVVTRKGRRDPEGAAGARSPGGAGTGWQPHQATAWDRGSCTAISAADDPQSSNRPETRQAKREETGELRGRGGQFTRLTHDHETEPGPLRGYTDDRLPGRGGAATWPGRLPWHTDPTPFPG
jgi:hypothetical protein